MSNQPITKLRLAFIFLLALTISACTSIPNDPTGFKPNHKPLNPKAVNSNIISHYAKLEKTGNRYQLKFVSSTPSMDKDKIGYVNLTTLKPWLDRKYLGGQVCNWFDGCMPIQSSNSKDRANSLMYRQAIATEYYHKKINWVDTAAWQTFGQALALLPLFSGAHEVWAKFSEKDFEAALDQALGNKDVDTLYLAALEAEKKRQAQQAQLKREQEKQQRIRQEQERIQREKDIEKEKQKQQTMRNLWNTTRTIPKQVGDKICTFESNIFGYVEQVAGNGKIQIRQRGKVTNKPAGLFFGLYNGKFNFSYTESNNSIIWANSNEWGKCEFDN